MKLFIIIALGVICYGEEHGVGEKFPANLYREMAKKDTKTFLVCPLSAKLALALVQTGAGGKTAEELAKVLDLPKNSLTFLKQIRQLVLQLHGNKDYHLNNVNKLYLQDGFSIKKQYKTSAANIFKADVQNINFSHSKQASKIINEWIEKHTDHKISDMVAPQDLSALTSFVLINAIYFRGEWVTKFNKNATISQTFYRSPNDTVKIDMMLTKSTFKYYENSNLAATYLELPYHGEDVTMTVVLPNTHEGLRNLEVRIAEVLRPVRYRPRDIYVVIPKFKIETTIELKPILRDLGIKAAFSPNANFSGIADALPSITKVMQKSFIEVDEEGTTAAAATAAWSSRTRKVDNMSFTADRPFIFYIKSKAGIVFIGRYAGPK